MMTIKQGIEVGLQEIDPEIIGVRGMVCGGDRSTMVKAELVAKAIQMVR